MPSFYSPTRREFRFTHFPRGILDGTDDEYEFDEACDEESVASSPCDCDRDDEEVTDETETVVLPNEAEPISTKKKETPFELLKRLEEEESEDEDFNKMLETPNMRALKLYFEGFIIYSTNILLLPSFYNSFYNSTPQNTTSNQYKISVETTYTVKPTSVLAQSEFTP